MHARGLPVVAVRHQPSASLLPEMMRAAVRKLLHTPFETTPVQEGFTRVQGAVERVPRPANLAEHVLALLPSKPRDRDLHRCTEHERGSPSRTRELKT